MTDPSHPMPPAGPPSGGAVPPGTGWPSAPPAQPPAVGAPPVGFGSPPPLPPAGPAPAPPGPPSSGRGVVLAIAAVIVVVALLAGGVLVVRQRSASSDSAAPATTAPSTGGSPSTTRPRNGSSPSTSAAPADPEAIRQRAVELQRYVEKERGLTYEQPVEVQVLDDAAFKARVLQEFDKDRASLERQGRLLQAGGLIPTDVDAVEAQRQLLGEGVLGFYDPVTKALVVRGTGDTPFLREIMVHELTHALDDQHFDLDRPELSDRKDGSDWGFLALTEGNARRIEYAYVDQMSEADRQQLQQEQLQLSMGQLGSVASTPLVLPQLLMAPYDYGNPFVQHLLDAGGQARLDAAFTNPPTSSEQIIDPARFDAGDAPKAVPAPPADGTVVDEGVLGALMTSFIAKGDPTSGGLESLLGGLLGGQGGTTGGSVPGVDQSMDQLLKMLQQLLASGGDGTGDGSGLEGLLGGGTQGGSGGGSALPGDDPLGGLGGLLGGSGSGGSGGADALNKLLAPPLLKGWGGDHYVVYTKASGATCLRFDWVGDDAASATAAKQAFDARAASDPKVVVQQTAPDTVRVTSCTA